MATAEQIKSLLQSHYKNDNERFTSIALQVAAHEARQGHMSIAKEIKDLIDRAKIFYYFLILFRIFSPKMVVNMRNFKF